MKAELASFEMSAALREKKRRDKHVEKNKSNNQKPPALKPLVRECSISQLSNAEFVKAKLKTIPSKSRALSYESHNLPTISAV
jgi:hypothetical protein